MPKGKLLEDLAENRNCFISSLRDPSVQEEIFRDMYHMDSDRYNLEEWNYCISYLTGHKIEFIAMDSVKSFVLQTGWPDGKAKQSAHQQKY